MSPATGCFTRQLRLLKPEDFKRVFEHGCRSYADSLTVVAAPNGLDHPRLGLAIAKKQIKTAVARNRLKRQIRESFRQNQEALAGLDVVVMARNSAVRCTNQQIRRSLDRHWPDVVKRCSDS